MLAAWRLTKPASLTKVPETTSDQNLKASSENIGNEFNQQIETECGSDVWVSGEGTENTSKNSKGKNWTEYTECHKQVSEKFQAKQKR